MRFGYRFFGFSFLAICAFLFTELCFAADKKAGAYMNLVAGANFHIYDIQQSGAVNLGSVENIALFSPTLVLGISSIGTGNGYFAFEVFGSANFGAKKSENLAALSAVNYSLSGLGAGQRSEYQAVHDILSAKQTDSSGSVATAYGEAVNLVGALLNGQQGALSADSWNQLSALGLDRRIGAQGEPGVFFDNSDFSLNSIDFGARFKFGFVLDSGKTTVIPYFIAGYRARLQTFSKVGTSVLDNLQIANAVEPGIGIIVKGKNPGCGFFIEATMPIFLSVLQNGASVAVVNHAIMQAQIAVGVNIGY